MIYIFCSGLYQTSDDPIIFGLDHDHLEFDEMIFLIQNPMINDLLRRPLTYRNPMSQKRPNLDFKY